MNLSHFFSHTFCVPVMFSLSLSLFHCLRLCVSDFSPLHLLSSPLRPPLLSVSPPVERLSREGNDSVTAQFFFVYGSLNHLELVCEKWSAQQKKAWNSGCGMTVKDLYEAF